MATTISLVPVARWRVTGYSDGPQGADGVPVLAREAYNDMLSAQWQPDDALPQMPVHDYDRTAPRGQAYKCVYGYDADARTERSSCGAECYTYRIPADALNAQHEDGVATIGSATVRIAADRYLAQGCCLWAELSPSATPSPVAVAIGSGIGPYVVADNQTAPDGSAIAPNKRESMQADIVLDLADAAPAQYLHVHLFLADYLGTRGAWIEGGAMFEAEGADVGFSRDVEVDAPGAGLDAVALDVGRVTFGQSITPAYALQHLPRAAMAVNFGLTGYEPALNAKVDTSFQARVTDLLAFLESAPALWAQGDGVEGETPEESVPRQMVAASATVGYAATGLVGVSSTGVSFCALVAHGLTSGRSFRGLRLTNALALNSVPCRLLVYGIADDIAIATSVADSVLRFATPLPWWGDVLSRQFRRGEATTLRVVSNSALSDVTMPTATEGKTASVPVQPLAARDCAEEVSYIEFDRPFVSGQLSSVLLALIPNGAPSGETESETILEDCPVTRTITARIPVSATRTNLTAEVTLTNCRIRFSIVTKLGADISKITSFPGVTRASASGDPLAYNDGYAYLWGEHLTARSTTVWRKSKFATASLSILKFSFSHGGKAFSYDTTAGDPCPKLQFKADFYLGFPPTACDTYGPLDYQYSGAPSGTVSVVAHAADGTTMRVALSFNENYTVTMRVPNPDAYTQSGWASVTGAGGLIRQDGSPFYFGYVAPRDWYNGGSGICNSYAYNDSSDTESSLITSAISNLPAFAYSFASAANEGATAEVSQSGTVSFVREGVRYSASWTRDSNQAWGLRNKTAATTPVGNSLTAVADVAGNVAAFSGRLPFTGSDGSILWAFVSIPAAALAEGSSFRAVTAYNNGTQGIGSTVAAGLLATVTFKETYANATIDPGLMMLVE